MSASLVGSEMCIRDRGGRLAGWQDGRMAGWQDGRLAGWQNGRREGGMYACLLYTSDAADDM
eukprot:12264343-Alexandrium_andersonii.AAC.1